MNYKGLRVLALESRRAEEMKRLIERQDGAATVVPSMRELPLEDNPAAIAFETALFNGEIDITLWMTGVGTRMLARDIETRWPRTSWTEKVASTVVVTRGPKPLSALRELGIAAALNAPAPNTWREMLAVLDAADLSLQGKRIALQEYGALNASFTDQLEQRGAEIMSVPVYRWALPEDTGQLLQTVQNLIDGAFDVVLWTTGTQVWHLFKMAGTLNREADLRAALNRTVIASVGPTTSEALREFGLEVDFEPDHPKMGQLVNQTAQASHALLSQKRANAALQ